MLTNRAEFVPAADAEIFLTIPATPAVFLLRGDDPQSEPYASKTANLRRRVQRLLGLPTEHSKKLNLRERARWIEYTPTGSDFESGFLLYRVLRSLFPKTYSDRLRLRFAPLVKLHLENEYPRASVTTRLGRLSGRNLYYGPFPSRPAAEKFASDSLDFFKMRRCVDDLHPDPKFPGCIYSEMKMCLAPCFKGCTDDEYRAEVTRVQNYFDSGGDSLVREISAQRDQASSNLDLRMQPPCTPALTSSSRFSPSFPKSCIASTAWRASSSSEARCQNALRCSEWTVVSFQSLLFFRSKHPNTRNRNPWSPAYRRPSRQFLPVLPRPRLKRWSTWPF